MLVGHAAAPPKGAYVVDVCAAPGGKSLHIAELLKGSGHVEARDITPAKVSLIEENISRLRLDNIKAAAVDATVRDGSLTGKADIVLADLPCSGLGIIGRKPDIKYNASEEGCLSLSALQKKILGVVSEYVKPDGVLIYSTCTLNRQENIENARWFVDSFDFGPESLEGRVPKEICTDTAGLGYVELLPGVTGKGFDGFFIAGFRRKAR